MPNNMESSTNQTPETETTGQTNNQKRIIYRSLKHTSQVIYSLRVITSNITHEIFYLVKPTTLMRRLKKTYCIVTQFKYKDIHFTYKNHRITDSDTPKTLGMKSNDIIVVQMNCDTKCKCFKYYKSKFLNF